VNFSKGEKLLAVNEKNPTIAPTSTILKSLVPSSGDEIPIV